LEERESSKKKKRMEEKKIGAEMVSSGENSTSRDSQESAKGGEKI